MSALDQWWRYRAESLSQAWNLNLECVSAVARAGDIQPRVPVVTVAGTNGKGSICRFLESIAQQAGLRVGVYSSPHLFSFNERVRLAGEAITDAELAQAFESVATTAGVQTLSVYEFDTLAAMVAFSRVDLDVIILEVGLGGRLDAVNIWDADVAVIAAVDLDHQQWLGETREAIGAEKAGILRYRHPVVIADRAPPESILRQAEALASPCYRLGHEFRWQDLGTSWEWQGPHAGCIELGAMRMPQPYQRDNASAAIMALELLLNQEAPKESAVKRGVAEAHLPGRCQRIDGEIPLWFEVGHNAQAVGNLLDALQQRPVAGRSLAVFAALADKDIASIVNSAEPVMDHWFLPDLDDPRACAAGELHSRVVAAGVVADRVTTCDNTPLALLAARAMARPGDQIIVFGSFLTVAAAMGELPRQ